MLRSSSHQVSDDYNAGKKIQKAESQKSYWQRSKVQTKKHVDNTRRAQYRYNVTASWLFSEVMKRCEDDSKKKEQRFFLSSFHILAVRETRFKPIFRPLQ